MQALFPAAGTILSLHFTSQGMDFLPKIGYTENCLFMYKNLTIMMEWGNEQFF